MYSFFLFFCKSSLVTDGNVQYTIEDSEMEITVVQNSGSIKSEILLSMDKTKSISKLTISGHVSIPSSIFREYKQLKEVILSSYVNKISDNCFRDCSSLIKVFIPHTIEEISFDAFRDCIKLTEVLFETTSAEKINLHYRSFEGCISINQINLPSVTLLNTSCFYNCSRLDNFVVPSINTYIPIKCFMFCTNLKTITLPDSIKQIKDYSFANCESMINFACPKSLKHIYANSFRNNHHLQSITFGNMLETILGTASAQCISLKSVSFPSSLKFVHSNSFSSCKQLSSIRFASPSIISYGSFIGISKQCELLICTSNYPKIEPTFSFTDAFPENIRIYSIANSSFYEREVIKVDNCEFPTPFPTQKTIEPDPNQNGMSGQKIAAISCGIIFAIIGCSLIGVAIYFYKAKNPKIQKEDVYMYTV